MIRKIHLTVRPRQMPTPQAEQAEHYRHLYRPGITDPRRWAKELIGQRTDAVTHGKVTP